MFVQYSFCFVLTTVISGSLIKPRHCYINILKILYIWAVQHICCSFGIWICSHICSSVVTSSCHSAVSVEDRMPDIPWILHTGSDFCLWTQPCTSGEWKNTGCVQSQRSEPGSLGSHTCLIYGLLCKYLVLFMITSNEKFFSCNYWPRGTTMYTSYTPYSICRESLAGICGQWSAHTFRSNTIYLPPSSDIPDRVVKGRGALLARRSSFTGAIRNVRKFLWLYKSLAIVSQI